MIAPAAVRLSKGRLGQLMGLRAYEVLESHMSSCELPAQVIQLRRTSGISLPGVDIRVLL